MRMTRLAQPSQPDPEIVRQLLIRNTNYGLSPGTTIAQVNIFVNTQADGPSLFPIISLKVDVAYDGSVK